MMDADYLIKIIRGVIMVSHLQRSVERSNVNDYNLLLLSLFFFLFLSFSQAFQLRGLEACWKSDVPARLIWSRETSPFNLQSRDLCSRKRAKVAKSVLIWFKLVRICFRLGAGRISVDSEWRFGTRSTFVDCEVSGGGEDGRAGWRPRVDVAAQVIRRLTD